MSEQTPGPVTVEPRQVSNVSRALQSTVVGLLSVALVQTSAFLSGATFDRLPAFLDVVLVMFGYPIVTMIGVLLVYAKILTPLWPRLLHRPDGHEADLPSLLMLAFLGAAVTGIYPGMFPYRTHLQLVFDGAALDVPPTASAPTEAGYYRFRDARLVRENGGALKRKVVVRDAGISRTVLVETHVAPIVDPEWTREEPVLFWATAEGDLAPWAREIPPLRGLREPDIRGHALRAVTATAERRSLVLAEEPILVVLGAPWTVELERTRVRSLAVLVPAGLLVFVVAWRQTWRALAPREP